MADDLAAFFAKKKDKKKKGVVNLDEVGQHLERKVKILEQRETSADPDFESEFAPAMDLRPKESGGALKTQAGGDNDEDSEWLEYSEKPAIGEFKFKDFDDQDKQEIEEEKKGSSAETNRTWNIGANKANDENVNVAPKPPVKSVYQPPGQSRRAAAQQLDITNEMMFPSIGDAEKIEKEEKIKAEERKKVPQTTAISNDDQFETKRSPSHRGAADSPRYGAYNDARAAPPFTDRYEPPRPRYEAPSRPMERNYEPPRGAPMGRRNDPAADSASPADDAGTWRSSRARPVNDQPAAGGEPPLSTGTRGWRTEPPAAQAITNSSADSGSWRSDPAKKPVQSRAAPAAQTSESAATAPASAGRYIPPALRNKNN